MLSSCHTGPFARLIAWMENTSSKPSVISTPPEPTLLERFIALKDPKDKAIVIASPLLLLLGIGLFIAAIATGITLIPAMLFGLLGVLCCYISYYLLYPTPPQSRTLLETTPLRKE